jgi:hypothetical protein
MGLTMGQRKAVTVIKARAYARQALPCRPYRAGYRVASRTLSRTTQAMDGYQ